MKNLTEAAKLTRDLIKFGGFLLVLFVLGYVGWLVYQSRPQPAPPVVPTVEFGKLPPLKFPREQEQSRPAFLTLQTIRGGPPEATPVAAVYRIPQRSPGLLAAQQARSFASELGFSPDPVEITADSYIFVDPSIPARTLSYNLAWGNFDLEYDLTQDSTPLQSGSLPRDEKSAVRESEDFLYSSRLIPSYIGEGQRTISYLSFENGITFPADNSLQADLLRVDFSAGNIMDMPVKYPRPGRSSVYVILSPSSRQGERVVKAQYRVFPPDFSSGSTYPLKTSQAAWEELQEGGGYISSSGAETGEVYVRDGFLAYYDSGEYQEYLQPIFVFTGDNGFEAYVQAISPDYTE